MSDKNLDNEDIPEEKINNDSDKVEENLIQEVNENKIEMEIHHPHHGHHNKKFKDYIFEFFMLFLAVTAGFIVENIREKYVENHREHQYIESLHRDIIADTISMQDIIKSINLKLKCIDSVMTVLDNPNAPDFINKFYYFSLKYLNSINLFTHVDRTISQLKSSGGMRMISEAHISDSIVTYYNSIDNIEVNNKFCLDEFGTIINYQKQFFNFKILKKISFNDLLKEKNIELIFYDKNKINFYYNEVITFYSYLINYKELLKNLNIQAKNLILLLKAHYKIK